MSILSGICTLDSKTGQHELETKFKGLLEDQTGELSGLKPPTIGWNCPPTAGQQKLDTKCKGRWGARLVSHLWLIMCRSNLEGNFALNLQIPQVVCFARHTSISSGSLNTVLQMLQVLCFFFMWLSSARLLPKGALHSLHTWFFVITL